MNKQEIENGWKEVFFDVDDDGDRKTNSKIPLILVGGIGMTGENKAI